MPLYPPPSGGGAAVTASASNGSFTAGLIAFSNANNVTFGTSAGSIITASVVPGGGSHNILAAGTQTANTTGTVVFSNSNGMAFGMSNNSIITASYTVPSTAGLISAINLSAGTTSSNQSSIGFSNGNGMSFGFSGASITGSYTVPTVTNSSWSVSDAASSGTVGRLAFTNLNGVTLSLSTGAAGSHTIVGSHNGLTSQSNQNVTAGNGGFAFQTLSFSNVNGFSFGTSAGSAITGSYTVPSTAGLISAINVSAGTTSSNQSSIGFSNANGISFGFSNASITASHNALTTAMASNRGSDFVQATAAFAGTNASGTIASNGISVSVNPAAAGVGIAAGTRTATTAGNLLFDNANGITFGLNAPGGSIMTASHNAITTGRASTDAVGLNTALTAGPLAWTVNSSGISLNAGSAAGTTSGFGGNLISGSMTHNTAGLNLSLNHPAWLTTAMQTGSQSQLWIMGNSSATVGGTNISGTMYSNGLSLSAAAPGGGVNPVASASNGSFSFTTLGFSNANNVTFGTSAGSIITASVAAPGAAAENNWMHALGANTAGNTTASGSTIGLSGINLTISGTNNSVFNFSVPATSSLSATGQVSLSTNGSTISIGVPSINTLSSYWEGLDQMTLLHAGANGNISVERFKLDQHVSATMIGVPLYQSISSSATANTYGQQMSVYAMILTNDTVNNRLMSLSSSSVQTTYTMASNTAGSTGIVGSGVRPITCPININATPGIYYLAFNVSTNTFSSGTATTALNRTASYMGRNAIASASFAMVSHYTQATANTVDRLFPQGVVSGGASAGIPATISHSQMTMTGLSHSQANLAFFFRA